MTTTGSTPVGTYPLTITGTSGTLTHTATVSLVVNAQPPPPDFTITASPEHADGDRWKHDDVYGNDWSIERVRRGGDAKRDGITDGSDAEFLAGDGDGGREFDTYGDDER